MEDEILSTIVKPTTNETYVILLDNVNDSFVCEVIEVNEPDNYAIFKNVKNNKEYKFLLKFDELIMKSSDPSYHILDIERVIPFDLNILKEDLKQLDKQLTSDIIDGLDITLDEINDKDKVFTSVELREDLLSSLMFSFDGYDNNTILRNLNDTVDNLLELMSKTDKTVYIYNIKHDKPLPKWLIPVTDNPIKIYRNELDPLAEIFDIYAQDKLPYNQLNQLLYQAHRPIEASLSDVGYYTNNVDTYFRDCLTTASCLSSSGNYSYDMRKNKHNTESRSDNNINIIHPADHLNIIGLLFLSENEFKHNISFNNNLFTLNETVLLNSIHRLQPYQTLKNAMITSVSLTDEFILNKIDENVCYTFTKRYENKSDYLDTIKDITPTIDKLLDNIDDTLKSTILNYKDFKTVCVQYEIDPYCLESSDMKLINDMISGNVKRYLEYNATLRQITVNEVLPKLPLELKMKMAIASILSMTNIPTRNEYIKQFIKVYTRPASGVDEGKLWLYNKYNNQRSLCRHYELLSSYHNNKASFNSMISLYGGLANDGIIHCKNCGEYLCDEDFSLFEGFSDEQPSASRDVIVNDVDLFKDFKETDILLVKQLSSSLGTKLLDEDIALVLESYKSMSNDILANIRYKSNNITVTDEHPRVKEIRKKYSKDKNKKKLISNDINEFQLYIKNTNKIILLLSLVILVLHTGIPGYEHKKGKNISFIEFSDALSLDTVSYNMKYIDLSIHNTIKLCDSYKTDEIWSHYKQVSDEYKLYDVQDLRNQIANTVNYLVSPQYPKIQDRLILYRTYLLSSKNAYVKYEWPTYKPLLKSTLYAKVNTVLLDKDKEYFDNYILNYNNYPVENISLITDIVNSKNMLPYELVNLDVSEIMVNKAFLLLFNMSVSNYGNKVQTQLAVDLHIERFLLTVKKTDEMRAIFSKHKWETAGISFKTLRTKIIPEIIAFYLNIDTDLSPCFSDEALCNQFIHTNVNNYDLHLITTKPKRVYQYKPFNVYPYGTFEEVDDNFKEKLFKKYCTDPSGNIIKRFINNNYLGKYLLPHTDDLEDNISVYEHPLRNDEPNFKDIMNAVKCGLPMNIYHQPKFYGIDDYNIDIFNTPTKVVYDLLRVIQNNNSLDLQEDDPLFTILLLIVGKDSYAPSEVNDMQREINRGLSSLNYDEIVLSCSRFISNVGRENKMLKRFENIFINTTSNININEDERKLLIGDGFRYRNMRETDVSKVFNMFIKGDKLSTGTCFHYLYTLKLLISRLSTNFEYNSTISKYWKLRENDKQTMNNYMKNNTFLLHQDIFRRESIYKGFYNYQEPILFQELFAYLTPYLKDIDVIKITDLKFINPVVNTMISKYLLCLVLSKLIEFTDKLKEEDEVIVASLERKYLAIGEEMNVYVCVNTLEKFTMDFFINIFEVHYDSRWVVSNTDTDDLSKRLSKQKEKEKQQVIQTLDTMSDEKRASTVELQKIGVISIYHQSVKANEERIINEYTNVSEEMSDVDADEIAENDIIDLAVSISTGEIREQATTYSALAPVEEGYYDENDFDEDGVMGDELQEFDQEDLLDNQFNI